MTRHWIDFGIALPQLPQEFLPVLKKAARNENNYYQWDVSSGDEIEGGDVIGKFDSSSINKNLKKGIFDFKSKLDERLLNLGKVIAPCTGRVLSLGVPFSDMDFIQIQPKVLDHQFNDSLHMEASEWERWVTGNLGHTNGLFKNVYQLIYMTIKQKYPNKDPQGFINEHLNELRASIVR